MTIRRRGVLVLMLFLASCNGIEYPSSPTGTTAAKAATTINIVATPAQLPQGGGTSAINIEVLAGLAGVAAANVQLTASEGALSVSEIVADSTGHARVEWRGTRTGTITARVGDVVSNATIRVLEPAVVNPPTTPAPPPSPAPHPGPSSGDLTVRLEMTAAFTGEPVTFSATVSGNGVPFALSSLHWDMNGDGQPDRSGTPVTWTYASAGPQTVDVVATASDGRRGDAGWRFTVQPADLYTVTLAASPSSAATGTTITLSANVVSRNGTLPAGLMFEWDFNGDGTTDATTAESSTTTSYTTAGSKSVNVTAVAGDGRRVSASTTVTITAS